MLILAHVWVPFGSLWLSFGSLLVPLGSLLLALELNFLNFGVSPLPPGPERNLAVGNLDPLRARRRPRRVSIWLGFPFYY